MLRVAYFVFCVFLLISCEKNDDFPPEIIDLHVEVVDSVSDTLWAGGEIQVSVTVTDDVGLQDLRVEILENTANTDTLAPFEKNIGSWSELEIVPVEDLEDEVEFTFVLPETIIGEWTLAADVIDAAGHKAETWGSELWVYNDLIPTMEITGFSPELQDGLLSVVVGGVVSVNGVVASETALLSLSYVLLNSSGEEEWIESFLLNEVTTIALEAFPIQLPEELAGSLILSIRVTDIEERLNCLDVACVIAD